MLRRPNGRPDGPGDQIADQNSTVTKIRLSIWSPGAIRSSNVAFEFFRGPDNCPKGTTPSLSGHQSGHLEQSGRPGAIWSLIRSPEHLVVDLVLVDAFSFSILMK